MYFEKLFECCTNIGQGEGKRRKAIMTPPVWLQCSRCMHLRFENARDTSTSHHHLLDLLGKISRFLTYRADLYRCWYYFCCCCCCFILPVVQFLSPFFAAFHLAKSLQRLQHAIICRRYLKRHSERKRKNMLG